MWHKPAFVLKVVAAVNLIAMMVVTAVDVFGRYVLNAPLPGAFEMTEVMMGMLVFSVLPVLTAADDHITIGLFDRWFVGSARHVKKAGVALVSAVFVGIVTWRIWLEAGRMAEYQDRTAFLGIPLWPLAYFMAAMMAITLLALLGLAALNLRTLKRVAE